MSRANQKEKRNRRRTDVSLGSRRLHRSNANYSNILMQVPRDKWPENSEGKLIAAWRSNEFLVQVFDEAQGIIRITVNRTEIGIDGEWKDGITWEQLQKIKDTIGYIEYDAVELYPAHKDVVRVHHMRHLWVMPAPLDYVWRDGKGCSG